MEPITVIWNGDTTVEQAIETPDDTMTAGEFAAAFAQSRHEHKKDWGPGHGTWGFLLDGEAVPDDAPVDLLGGETVELRLMVEVAPNAPAQPDEVAVLDPDKLEAEKPKAKRASKATKKS